MDSRLEQLTAWVEQQLKAQEIRAAYPAVLGLVSVSGDASFRRYFRLHPTDAETSGCVSLIAVDAPPPHEDCRPFVSVATGLLAAEVFVPRVYSVDYELGFMLLSDLGDHLLLHGLSADNVEKRYQLAIDCLPKVMSCEAPVKQYGEQKLLDEMKLFPDWFLRHYLEVAIDNDLLNRSFDFLVRSALEQPQVFVHRDYHCRNLMLTPSGHLGVIDFQDAVCGPISYDLVSLLRDCYVAWPLSQVQAWVERVRMQLQQQGLLALDVSQQQFMQWFDLMGAQRHLKAIGIFARLNCRDGKPGYLTDIPRTLRYLLDVALRYPELNALAVAITDTVLPRLLAINSAAAQWFEMQPRIDFVSVSVSVEQQSQKSQPQELRP